MKTPPVSGLARVVGAIRQLTDNVPYRAMQPALNKAAQYGAKAVKASIPGRYKTIRKAIGWRAKRKKAGRGEPGTKIGAGVGKRGATSQKERQGRPGVGIDRANIHWWFLGTQQRTTGTKRKRIGGRRGRKGRRGTEVRVDTGTPKNNRGRMPAQGEPISVIVSRNSGQMRQIIRTWVAIGVKKEAERARKKRR